MAKWRSTSQSNGDQRRQRRNFRNREFSS